MHLLFHDVVWCNSSTAGHVRQATQVCLPSLKCNTTVMSHLTMVLILCEGNELNIDLLPIIVGPCSGRAPAVRGAVEQADAVTWLESFCGDMALPVFL